MDLCVFQIVFVTFFRSNFDTSIPQGYIKKLIQSKSRLYSEKQALDLWNAVRRQKETGLYDKIVVLIESIFLSVSEEY